MEDIYIVAREPARLGNREETPKQKPYQFWRRLVFESGYRKKSRAQLAPTGKETWVVKRFFVV